MSRIDPSTVLAPVLDEVSHMTFVYFLIGALIIYIAWRSTFVRHEARNIPYRQRTVFIFNPQTGDFQQHSLGLLLNNLNNNFAQTTPTFESILDEMNGITYQSPPPQQDENIDDDSVIEEETQEIIREMDREPNNLFENQSGLRNRRTNTVTGNNNNTTSNNNNVDPIGISTDRVDTAAVNTARTGCDTENRTNGSTTIPEEDVQSTSVGGAVENISSASNEATYSSSDEITIKLKYLNDDLKIVKARTNEPIGDFKKRNFNEELNAQKLVRLVFNGHVLQPDAKTIAACGLFDNCVVHCLIHNRRPNTVTESNPLANNQQIPLGNEDVAEQMGINNLMNSNQNRNRNTQRLLNLSLFLICLSVVISWFFRIQYFQLFSWYSTVGLVLLTTFFLVIIPLIFLIEREIFRNL
ncbi:transmembrane and ubiquitin-like domain-containing protein 1 [Contarinia nasturtii]|uniref:transmembrane and ubiquitin-like domain-containing protein 1 n=1 Tax=Contarinia nasturtii TaxID=265458 RepID=UPI0012D4A0E0|nr:transmembrane and ubiquitin-like domain-containing protein 1 [Contarinia nasturtii]XP_031632920.1 transmembrane and ubiquitin-like domain-containing protein 1 [Contarinia nasturtii]XP_031632921.1 transmembrane and ubiquitin-like domain-containing protein 1 [Contarinia nasturtii]XP_031632922.1 transmembrane and ubiquitin-like domain-containing protein 1 [Contarinia nasturtii]XP_031632923.1 transmembrane and ubiquitin-like domain-containing protein 1 [Contarinia nasturtii]XP_031632924.1 trans